MKRGQGRLQRKGITSLSIITTPVIVLATTLCVLALQQELPSLFGIVASGDSFFFPAIPAINLLGFLPEGFPAPPFTIGNLVDMTIDTYIILTIGIIPYRCHKSVREPGITFKDLHLVFLTDPADIHTIPCVSKSGSAQRNSVKHGGDGTIYSEMDQTSDLSRSFTSYNHRDKEIVLKDARERVYRIPFVRGTRNNPASVIVASMIASLSLSALYSRSRSRSRLYNGHNDYRTFSRKSRINVSEFFIRINNLMEK